MGEKVAVRGMMSVSMEVPFTAEIDMDEFYEWSDGEELDTGYAVSFLESDRDYPDNVKIEPVSPVTHKITDQFIEYVKL